jgi:hypothetical protein
LSAFVEFDDEEGIRTTADAWMNHVHRLTASFVRENRQAIVDFAGILLEREMLLGSEIVPLIERCGVISGSWSDRLVPRLDDVSDEGLSDCPVRRTTDLAPAGETRVLQESAVDA